MRLNLNKRDALHILVGSVALAMSTGMAAMTASAQNAAAPVAAQQTPPQAKIKEPVTAVGCKDALSPGKPYFVEFRSRGAASYGHTFVFHGRLGGGNRFAEFKVAGLHPKGDE